MKKLLLILLTALSVNAANKEWNGDVGNNWSDDDNWQTTHPINGDSITYENGDHEHLNTQTNDLTSLSVNGIIFNASSGPPACVLSGNDLTLAGNIVNGSAYENTIDINMTMAATRTFTTTTNGLIIGGVLSGNGGLTKTGASYTLTLSGTNTYTGATTVSSGKLNVNGSTHSSSAITIDADAILGGTGTCNGAVSVSAGGILSPGAATGTAGTLSTGALTLASTSILAYQLAAPAGTSDKIVVTGNLTLDGTINVTALTGFYTGSHTIMTYSGTLTDNGLTVGTMPDAYNGTIRATGGVVYLDVSLKPLTWDGSKDNNFNDTANWTGTVSSGDSLSAGDSLIFASGSTAATMSKNATIGALVVTGYTGTISMQSYTMVVSGAVANLGGATLAAGTSTLSLVGAAAQTVTSAGEAFYAVTVNRSTTGTLLFSGAASLHTLTVSATNTQAISWTGTTMTASGDITLDGTGTHVFGTAVTLTGASSTLHIGSTLTAPTASACPITMTTATAGVFDIDKATVFRGLILSANSKVVSSGAATTTLGYYNTAVGVAFGGGVKFTNNAGLNMRSEHNSSIAFSLVANDTFAGTGQISFSPNNGTQTTIPATVYTGSGAWIISDQGVNFPMNVTLSGDLNIGTATLYSNNNSAHTGGNYMYFRTAGYTLTCGAFVYGATSTGNPYQLSLKASTINCAIWAGATNNGAATTIDSLGASTINCTGSMTWGSNHVVVCGTNTINKTGSASAKTTPAGKLFYTFNIAKTGNVKDTIAQGDSLLCTNLGITGGGMFQYSNSPLRIAGNYSRTSTDSNYMSGEKTINGDWTVGAGAGGNRGGDSTLTILNGAGASIVTLNANRVGMVRIKKTAKTVAVTMADNDTSKTILDSTGCLITTGYHRFDSLAIFADSLKTSTNDTIVSNKIVLSTTFKPNLAASSRFYFDLARKDSLWNNFGTTNSAGNLSSNKSGDTLTVVGAGRYDTIQINDGAFRTSSILDTLFCNSLFINSIDTFTMQSPIVVQRYINFNALSKTGWTSTAKIISVAGDTLTITANGKKIPKVVPKGLVRFR